MKNSILLQESGIEYCAVAPGGYNTTLPLPSSSPIQFTMSDTQSSITILKLSISGDNSISNPWFAVFAMNRQFGQIKTVVPGVNAYQAIYRRFPQRLLSRFV